MGGGGVGWGGDTVGRGDVCVPARLAAGDAKMSSQLDEGRAAGGEGWGLCLLPAPGHGGLRCCGFFSATSHPFACRVAPSLGDPRWRS